jgi:hypothetical protein
MLECWKVSRGVVATSMRVWLVFPLKFDDFARQYASYMRGSVFNSNIIPIWPTLDFKMYIRSSLLITTVAADAGL